MSRALARLRELTGDPLLVRAGRGLAPTPRALELRERVHALVLDAENALRPAGTLRLDSLQRSFTLRCSDGFAENFGPRLLARLQGEAPGVHLHFLPKRDRTMRRCATARWTSTPEWWATKPGRSCECACCSATASSAWCAPAIR